ncbi:unnamed protein product [Didymodactylos carnosus]|uniref:Uncharacterized protein n=1 Tax=Didymodactylos carnosus TaxID=1234261 RepID=A0A813NZW3_9BILA|nr:unnamed protein product [Didymodactylos carnosus]CAF3522466.1 unnamed protein product [Didymodactylos carnosus]
MFPSTSTSSTKFLTHFRNLQTGDDKPGASETLAYLNGDLSFEEFEKYVRDSNTDFSFINVGKSLEAKDPKEPVKIDLDELIDELSDISDLSGFSSTAEESSNDDDNDKNTSLLKNTRNNKTKRKKIEIDDSDEESSNQNSNDKNSDTRKRQKKVSNTSSTDLRDRIVQHLEQIELEKKKKKRGRKKNNRQSSTTQAAHLKSTKVSDKTPRSRLTQEYQSLMGEANMAYAHGDVEKAVKICQEVILKAPHASEPYMTIATIYEDQNDLEKAFEMNFIAAHCLRKKEFWLQMLGECQKRKRQDLIGTCLTNKLNN